MYKRDLITAEIQKLADVLAKILKLTFDGDLENADILFNETIAHSFGLSPSLLFDPELKNFIASINANELPAEKLDMLSRFLYIRWNDSEDPEFRRALSQKLDFLYTRLEQTYHIVSFENIQRRQIIAKYL